MKKELLGIEICISTTYTSRSFDMQIGLVLKDYFCRSQVTVYVYTTKELQIESMERILKLNKDDPQWSMVNVVGCS